MIPVQHRDEEYGEGGFEILRDMQERHFWYRGRHRFLMEAVNRYLPKLGQPFSAIDLGENEPLPEKLRVAAGSYDELKSRA